MRTEEEVRKQLKDFDSLEFRYRPLLSDMGRQTIRYQMELLEWVLNDPEPEPKPT